MTEHMGLSSAQDVEQRWRNRMAGEEAQTSIENAEITSVSLTMADHGCLTFWLMIEGGGWGCGIGGYCIGNGYVGAKEFTASGSGLVAMMRIMDVVGVDRWEDLAGKYIRVETTGWGNCITKIGNVLTNKWFDLKEFFNKDED